LRLEEHSLLSKRLAKPLILFFLVLPAVVCIFFILRYGVNVVYWDQWHVVPLFEKLYSGNLTFADLLAQHNEHRILFPRLVMLSLGSLTHYNTVAEMCFSWFLLCLICFVLFKIYTKSSGRSWANAAMFIPVAWLVFNLRQFGNLLFGFQIAFFMLVLSFLLAVYFLQTSKGLDWRFAVACLCGLVCTYSIANGFLVWPIGLLQIMLISRSKESKVSYIKSALIWLVVSAITYISYFWGFYYHPTDLLSFAHHPFNAAAYALAAVGSFFSINPYTAVIAGAVISALYIGIGTIIIKNSKEQAPNLPYLSLMLFTIFSVALLVLGRSGLGLWQALSSRYITITMLGLVGLYLAILSVRIKFVNVKSPVFRSLICLLVIFILALDGYIFVNIQNMPSAPTVYSERKLAAYYLSTFEIQSDENLMKLYPDPEKVRQYAPILVKYRLNVFYQPK